MGFSTIIAWVGVFIVLMAALLGLMNLYNTHLTDMQTFFSYEKEVGERYRTDFEIDSTSADFSNIEVYLKNTGRTTVPTKNAIGETCFDVYIDGSKIPSSDYAFDVMNKTWSPLLWDPDEWMNISIDTSLTSGSHVLTVVDCVGVKKTSSILAMLPFGLEFHSPTEDDGASINQDWTRANVTIRTNDVVLDTFRFDWDGTDYDFYDDSLVLALNFNNNPLIGESSTQAVDSSRYGNNASCSSNCPDWTSSGKFGSGLFFNGNKNMTVAASDSISSVSTIEFWAYVNQSASDIGILDQYNGNIVYIRYQAAFGRYYYNLVTGGTNHFDNTNIQPYMNKWTHYAVTINASVCKLYIDGVNVENDTTCTGPATSTYPLVIGYDKDASGGYMNGTLDELRMYDRTLGSGEILMHYQSEFARYGSSEYRFYVNVTGIPVGSYGYYGWANSTDGREEQTDYGSVRDITRAS